MCGYARSVYENITCTPGLDLSSCSCFPLTRAAFIPEREGHTEDEDLSDTHMPTESDLFLQLNTLWHLYLAQQWWQSHRHVGDSLMMVSDVQSYQRVTTDVSHTNHLIPSFLKPVSQRPFSLLVTGTDGCASLCFPQGWSNSPGTSLLSESKGRGVRALGTHMGQGLLFPHMCLLSGLLLPSPNSAITARCSCVTVPTP